MADDNSTDQTPTPTPDTDTEHQGDPAVLGDAGKRALDAERKARAEAEKRAKELEARIQEWEDAQKTAEQRAADEAARAKAEAEAAKVEALRWRIAAKHGISDTDAETFLTGNDEASMTAQAERLVELQRSAAATPSTIPAPAPRPDLTQGPSSSATPLNSDALEQALRKAVGAS